MAQVPTSSITMAQIKAETGVATDATLDAARAASISYVRAANASPAGTGNNANVAPNNMRDWAGYLHTQSFATPTYYVDTGTTTANLCVASYTTSTAAEASAVANTTFYYKLNTSDSNNYMMEWYMDPDHNWYGVPNQNQASATRSVTARNTSGNVTSFTGNFTSGFTPMKIADLNVGPYGEALSLEARITAEVISGTGSYASTVSGYIITSGWVEIVNSSGNVTTAGSAKNGISPAAWTLVAGCFSTSIRTPYHRLTMQVKATGYETQTLNKFVSYHSASATSNNCV